MPSFTVFDIVQAADSERARGYGVAGAEGVVLRVAGDEPPHVWCLVLFGAAAYDLRDDDLAGTGRAVPRESVYDAAAVLAHVHGHVWDPAAGIVRRPRPRTYHATVWRGAEPGLRVSVVAASADEARALLEREHGAGCVYGLYDEEDAARPR